MFDFLKKKETKNSRPPSAPPTSAAFSSTQHSNVRRELIRVVLKDTLRLHGIPFDWLACEVIIIGQANGVEKLHIQLVIMKWKEPLLRYAPALQQQLLLGLDRFDPSVDHSDYIVSWRFSPSCGCPFSHLPEPKFWLKSAAPQVFEEPIAVLDRRRTKRPPKAPAWNRSHPHAQDQSTDFPATHVAPLS